MFVSEHQLIWVIVFVQDFLHLYVHVLKNHIYMLKHYAQTKRSGFPIEA